MNALKIGDRIQDCDPRATHRRGEIVEVLPNGYTVKWNTSKTTMVLADRIHSKAIRSGYRLLPPQEQPRAAPSSPPDPSTEIR